MAESDSVYEFDNVEYVLIEDNVVSKKDKKRTLMLINVFAMVIVVVLTASTFVLLYNGQTVYTFGILDLIVFTLLLMSFLPYIVIHEWLHGVAFRIFNKNDKSQINFGIVWKNLMAYCISTVPVEVRAARLSLMMPVYVVCIPLYILGVALDNVWIAFIAIFYLSGSAGDFYYLWKLRKTDKTLYMHEKNPTSDGYEIGYLLFDKKES